MRPPVAVKDQITISKDLIRKFLANQIAINKSEFQRECEVSNIISLLALKNEFTERMLRKIGTISIKYGYKEWFSTSGYSSKDGMLIQIYE